MNRRRSPRFCTAAPSPSIESLRFRLSRIVSRHEQLKVAFHNLNSEIRTGLLEAEDVFASLAAPLIKLVGLKTVEMAAEGRFSTIVTTADHSHSQVSIIVETCQVFIRVQDIHLGLDKKVRWFCRDRKVSVFSESKCKMLLQDISNVSKNYKTLMDDNYLSRATIVGNELMERQKLQLIQLIKLLKRIEAQVNSSQSSISQSLADHQAFMKKFFVKAFTFVSAIHQSSQSNNLSHMMLKLLKATFDHVGAALGSVETGVDDLIRELADKMCGPMVEYVNGLKVEMKTGTCSHLLEVVREMDGAMRIRKFELEEARNEARLAEQCKFEALSKLKALEGTARQITSPHLLIKYNTDTVGNRSQQKKLLPLKEDQAKDDNLIWELLRKKRRRQLLDSPEGTKGLLGIEIYEKKLNLHSEIPPVNLRPVTRSRSKGLDPQSSCMNNRRLFVGSSPSALTQKVLCGKRVTSGIEPNAIH